MKWDKIWEQAKKLIKKRGWYVFLLIISTIYVYGYRFEIYQMTELNAQNLIFVLWLILVGLPLFSEIEIGSVKLKKEIEETRTEVKESIGELKYQISELRISNSNSNMVFVGSQPLPTKEEMFNMQQHIKQDQTTQSVTDPAFDVSEKNLYLFKVRLSLEKQLSALCNIFQYGERRSMYSMIQMLLQHEVIDRNTVGLLREIINITNRGVHGEIVDDDYIDFVKKTYPIIKRTLDTAHNFYTNNSYYYECPKCHYRGPSKYSNACPNCGFTSDDY